MSFVVAQEVHKQLCHFVTCRFHIFFLLLLPFGLASYVHLSCERSAPSASDMKKDHSLQQFCLPKICLSFPKRVYDQ